MKWLPIISFGAITAMFVFGLYEGKTEKAVNLSGDVTVIDTPTIDALVDAPIKESLVVATSTTISKNISVQLIGKDSRQRAEIKSVEMAKIEPQPREVIKENIEVEIIDIDKIDGGVAAFARAWKDGIPVGFGADGTVEIERFRIFNPPVLVADPNGDIIKDYTDRVGKVTNQRFREDPKEALKQVIADNVRIVGKNGKNIVPGKIGNTTDTYYPNADPESTTVDGKISQGGSWVNTWTNTRNSATAFNSFPSNTSGEFAGAYAFVTSGNWNEMYRSAFLFDTSAIADTDTISSATFSIYVTSKADPNSEMSFMVGTSSPASNTNLTTSDWANETRFGTTHLASDIAYSSISTSAYNDFALNATGISNVSLTGITKLGVRSTQDADNSTPTWGASVYKHISGSYADNTGTTQDPKLVVVHTEAGGGAPTASDMLMFE